MYEQLRQQKDSLSHSYMCMGNIEQSRSSVLQFIEQDLHISVQKNPNLIVRDLGSLGINDARELSALQSKTALGIDQRNIFIVSFATATIEAQNALLKSIEEPTEGTLLFFLVPSNAGILPTVLSRVQVVRETEDPHYQTLVQEFMTSDFVGREKMYQQFLGDSKKDIPTDPAGASSFICELLDSIRQHKDSIDDWTVRYREIEQLENYVMDRSASLKYIFEYISIRLPQIVTK